MHSFYSPNLPLSIHYEFHGGYTATPSQWAWTFLPAVDIFASRVTKDVRKSIKMEKNTKKKKTPKGYVTSFDNSKNPRRRGSDDPSDPKPRGSVLFPSLSLFQGSIVLLGFVYIYAGNFYTENFEDFWSLSICIYMYTYKPKKWWNFVSLTHSRSKDPYSLPFGVFHPFFLSSAALATLNICTPKLKCIHVLV